MNKPIQFKTDPALLDRTAHRADPSSFRDDIATDDHKIRFVTEYAHGKDVLDIGCIDHDPENHRSRFWVHRALRAVSKSVLGMDLDVEGVRELQERGYNVVAADAQAFDFGRDFDLIVAADVIVVLEDMHGFFESCRRHLRPGGKLLISCPNPWHWKRVLRGGFQPREACTSPIMTHWVCPKSLRQAAIRHGFALQRCVFGSRYLIDRFPPLPEGWRHTSFHCEFTLV